MAKKKVTQVQECLQCMGDEEITSAWLSEHFKVEPYCWKLPVEGYYVGATTSGYYRGRFDVFRVEDDGDETTIGQVAMASHLLNLLNVIALAESVAVIRDNVLHERNQMAESGFDSDKVNAVLGIIDDATSGLEIKL